MSLRKLGRYGIVRVLGKGAMGVVYEGRDPNLERRVAIKTVKVENLSEQAAAEYEARFRTEARSAARLQHPNIVSVYDSDRDGDVAFLVMEYIQGDDLKQHLDKGERYSLEQSLRMIRDLLSALDYAHKQGIVHRDIKPANLLIEPGGRVKLTDFGVARIADSTDATRTQGAMVGTLKYMSPEQVQGQKIDARSDLFSVGVVLYQLLTDKRPFDGDNEFTIIQQIAGHMPPPPSSFNARLPAAIDAVVARALAKQRDQRFATARDFAVALQSAMRQAEDATVVPPPDPVRAAARMAAGASGASMTNPGTSPMGGSTVTQELELVYWKDVKDSTDPEDIQVFLNKFPDGIYAELARRRLRKLAVVPAPDQTLLSGMEWLTQADAPAAQEPSPVSPPAMEQSAPPAAASPAARVSHPVEPEPRSEPGFATTIAEAAPAQASPAAAAVVPKRATTAAAVEYAASADEATLPVPAPASSRPAELEPALQRTAAKPPIAPVNQRVAVFAGAAALAVIGTAVLLMLVRTGSEPVPSGPLSAASAVAPVASSAASASAAALALPASTPVPVVASEPAVAASVQPARHAAAAAPATHPAVSRRGGIASKTPAVAPPPVAVIDLSRPLAERAPPASENHPDTRIAAAPPRVAASNPADICKDKMFLFKEICLAEQCDKPAARSHPLCVQRRADAKLREESQVPK